MSTPGQKLLDSCLQSSKVIQFIQDAKYRRGNSRLTEDQVRTLLPVEINQLEAQGNRCAQWGRILVAEDFIPDHIENSRFSGDCVLGVFSGRHVPASGVGMLPSGIYDATVIDSEIGRESCIFKVDLIEASIVEPECCILSSRVITGSDSCRFGNGLPVPVGPETGGREVALFAEMTHDIASSALFDRSKAFQTAYSRFIEEYAGQTELDYNLFCSGSVVKQAGSLKGVCVGAGALIEGALRIENSLLHSTGEKPVQAGQGVIICDSCMKPGSRAASGALIERSLIMENSTVTHYAKVSASIIGPQSEIGCGEVTSSFLGPLTASHHQSLLISVLWPQGKGNTGYGANVGSNHTSKAPDQEIFCGEGMFFGLGINVKFPADFSESPYSIIATGVNTLPQKMSMPFSLINKPFGHYDVSPAYNEVFPGWVLLKNMYMLQRNMRKFQKRSGDMLNRINPEIFRPEIMALVQKAGQVLAGAGEDQSYFTGQEIPALGKNIITEQSRRQGIEAYDFILAWYALKGLATTLHKRRKTVNLASIYTESSDDPAWEVARGFLKKAGLDRFSVKSNLEKYIELNGRIEELTFSSKSRDEKRGKSIISDYMATHGPVTEDPVIADLHHEIEKEKEQIGETIRTLKI